MELNSYKPAVIVLAMQPGYLERYDMQLETPKEELVERISSFLDFSRELGIPVYFSRILEKPYQGEILPELLKNGDEIVDVEYANAFHGTSLDELLFREGIDAVIPAGVYRGVAVHATANSAYNMGFDILFSPDLSADPEHAPAEHPFYEGALRSLHNMSLRRFENGNELSAYLHELPELLPENILSRSRK